MIPNNGSKLPGNLVISEFDIPTNDPWVKEAYDCTGATYGLYYDLFERNFIVDNGMELISILHNLKGNDNNFGIGKKIVEGDGDEGWPEP